MAGVTGDFGKLARLIGSSKQLSSPGFRRDLYRNLAEEARSLVVEAFEKSEDPYGNPWKPSRQKRRGGRGYVTRGRGQILRDTSRLLGSLNSGIRTTGNGFSISTNVVYANVHNSGGLVRVKPGVQAHHADTGAFLRRRQGSTRQRDVQAQGRAPAVRISFRQAGIWRMPRRMFIPPASNIGPKWEKGFREVINAAVAEVFL